MAETATVPEKKVEPVDPKQRMFVRISVETAPIVIAALKAAGFEQISRDVEGFATDYTDPQANAERVRWYELAESTKAKDGEIEFDSDATISHSDDPGQYVLGWVWVEDPDYDEDAEDDDDD